MKNLILEKTHIDLGGKMMPFAGYNMPVRYSSDKEEHLCVRNAVGIFDVSHMGEFIIKGKGALELIQHITTNDASVLEPGKVQYSCLPNDQGGIVDDLLVYMLKEEKYALVVNASNIEKDWDWINQHNSFGASVENISDNTCLFALQGPKALDLLNPLTDLDLHNLPYYTFNKGNILEITSNAIISATGYTGAGGFEIYVENNEAQDVWDVLLEVGKPLGILPIGLGARDTLRMEKGFCLYGNDIDDNTSPIEAGLGWITKFTKDFINSDKLKAQKENGPSRKLIGFVMVDKGIPRSGYEIINDTDSTIGRVTSGTMSPSMNIGIGMGYVDNEYAKPNTDIYIKVRNKKLEAKVVKQPIFKG